MTKIDLDEQDRRILRALQDDPTLSVANLAEKTNMSHTPCWRRLKRLETSGVIEGKALILNRSALGFSIDAFANVRIKQHDEKTLEAFESSILRYAQIVQCFSMSGDSDYILRIVVGSIDEYERFLKTSLLHLPGVVSINSSFALKAVKLTTKLPV